MLASPTTNPNRNNFRRRLSVVARWALPVLRCTLLAWLIACVKLHHWLNRRPTKSETGEGQMRCMMGWRYIDSCTYVIPPPTNDNPTPDHCWKSSILYIVSLGYQKNRKVLSIIGIRTIVYWEKMPASRLKIFGLLQVSTTTLWRREFICIIDGNTDPLY